PRHPVRRRRLRRPARHRVQGPAPLLTPGAGWVTAGPVGAPRDARMDHPNGGGGRVAREFRTVGVVGLGTMGAGIVEVFARNGLQVVAVDVDTAAVERGRTHLETSTTR